MHEFDPNGSIKEYRKWRARRELIGSLLVGMVGCGLVLLIAYWRLS